MVPDRGLFYPKKPYTCFSLSKKYKPAYFREMGKVFSNLKITAFIKMLLLNWCLNCIRKFYFLSISRKLKHTNFNYFYFGQKQKKKKKKNNK